MSSAFPLKKLGDICENLDSKRVPITKNKRVGGKIPYYGASGIVDYVKDYLFDEDLLLVSEDGANLLARTYPIAFSIDGKTWVNNHAHVLRFENMTSQRFIEYYLNSMKLDNYVSGMAQPKLNQKSLNSILVPSPSFEDKKQIVAMLDKAFAAIDTARANIEQNIANAKELFQSKLNEIFSASTGSATGEGEGWEEKKLKEVCVLQRGFDLPRRLREKGEFPLVSSSGISDTHAESKVSAPGVVTGRSGSIGNVFYITEPFWPLNTVLYIKEFHGNNEKYVYYLLRYFDLAKYSSGTGVPTLNRNFVHDEVILTNQSKAIQAQIVERLDSLELQTKRLVCSYQKKLITLEEFKKSILQKAFTGELSEKEIAL